MSSPASEGTLGLLHDMLAAAMIEALKGQPILNEEGVEIGRTKPTPADFNAAAKFLKDNNITAAREGSKALEELTTQIGKATSVSGPDDEELRAALDNIVSFPGSMAHA